MRAKWRERRWACIRPGGASNTRNVETEACFCESKAASGRLSRFWRRTAVIKIGIVGGTGYTGVELLRLLAQHPQAELRAITSRKDAGTRIADMFPSLRGRYDLAFTDPADSPLARCDVVFFATPHGVAMAQARELTAAGVRIIDLAADFRLKDTAMFEKWYGMPHSCPELLAESVYGLPEVNRDAIRSARIVGNPGCYPT